MLIINSLPVNDIFLLSANITFVNTVYPDQAQQNVGHDLDLNSGFSKRLILKKNQQTTKNHEKFHRMQRVIYLIPESYNSFMLIRGYMSMSKVYTRGCLEAQLHHFKKNDRKNIKRHCVFYGVESWSGVLEWSGVRFWSGKGRMECSCDVCVAKFYVTL